MSVSKAVIKSMRKERGWSQDPLATISGLSERSIQRVETTGGVLIGLKNGFNIGV